MLGNAIWLSAVLISGYPSLVSAASYGLSDNFVGSGFLSGFSFEAIADPTNGRVNYVDESTALADNLTFTSSDTFIMRADATTTLSASDLGRNSVRIKSDKTYTTHVVVFDTRHMPEGCGTWPAAWETLESDWPDGGEVDIIEGVNNESPNQSTLHTSPDCTIPSGLAMTGKSAATNCDTSVNGNSGCGVQNNKANNYGPSFNSAGGGWYAMERTTSFIRVFFWSRGDTSVPTEVANGASSIDTDNWVETGPVKTLSSTGTDALEHAWLTSADLWEEFETPEKANGLLKLKAIHRFESAASAVEEITAIQEGKLSKGLRKFLSKEIVDKGKTKEVLTVIDTKLGASISKKLGIEVQASSSTIDLYRGIRSQLAALLDGLDPRDLAQMSLGLSHSLSRFKLKFSPDKVDTMVVQSIALLDDLDKEINIYSMRVKEWYGWHFPEMGKILTDSVAYAKVVRLMGFRTNAATTSLAHLLPEELEQTIKVAAEISMGTEISESDMANINGACDQVIAISAYRTQLAEYLRNRMNAIAPNLTALVGELVGARLISHAGSLLNLAKHPASTVQILGAEKALFRALKTKHDTPKYGLIYHASLVGQAPPKLKGKMARMVATKAALSIRVDALSDPEGKSEPSAPSIGIENRAKLESRLRALEHQGDLAGTRSFSTPGKKQVKFEANGETRTYNTNADAVGLVSTQREPVEAAMKAVADVKEEKRKAKQERRAKRRAEKEKGGAPTDENTMDVDEDEKKRKHAIKTEETEEERKARKKAKKEAKAAASASVSSSPVKANGESSKKKRKKSHELEVVRRVTSLPSPVHTDSFSFTFASMSIKQNVCPIVIVTGANGGVGFSICHRLLMQLAQRLPPDALPQRSASHNIRIDEDTDVDLKGLVDCDGITVILACRDVAKAAVARTELLRLLDKEVSRQKRQKVYDGHAERFRRNVVIDVHRLDLASVDSVFGFGREISSKYPYVSHLVCNAGVAPFTGYNWTQCIKQVLTDIIAAVTYPAYKLQAIGQTTKDGLGWTWQSNVFGHYILYRLLESLLNRYKALSSQPARVLWMTSLEACSTAYDPEDWQLLQCELPYEASKYQVDLLVGYFEQQEQRMLDAGLIAVESLNNIFLDYLMQFAFFIAHFLGSPMQVFTTYKAALSAVHLMLVALPFVSFAAPKGAHNPPTPLKFGSRVDFWFDEYVGMSEVSNWDERGEEESVQLVKHCDELLETFKNKNKKGN
ncbi:hypothetical protein EW145_g754 [Phellinidium pouzarii]|uniref:Nucleolar protein 58 n=1 Tax=Phellinidium pouzarii TaxID=167371 RepID=A0A4S4LHR2_9AGAM|nr:hypothetical protein EW145_g754 [Phellinidium pouzarii]